MSMPLLFDRRLLKQRRVRAAREGMPDDVLMSRLAEDMADRLGVVLRDFRIAADIASPGRELAARLSAVPNIERIVRLAPAGTLGNVIIDEEYLPLRNSSIDLAVSANALHLVNDLPGTLLQIRHALRPDGLFLAAFPGGETLIELRQAFAEAEIEVRGGISPRVSPFIDVRDAGALLQRAGFALPVTDNDRITIRYDSVFDLFRDLRALGATSILTQRSSRPLTRHLLAHIADIYAAKFADADGRIRATVDIVWMSGWVPHDSQQKPLKPGTAKARLADAFSVKEYSAGESTGRR